MIGYGGLPEAFTNYSTSKVAVLPVAYDGTSTWVKGADKGPYALLEASANMEVYDIETNSEVYRIGIFTDEIMEGDFSSPDQMVNAVRSRTLKLINDGKLVATIGGEHSVSIGAVQAHARTYDHLTVLQNDAHADMRSSYERSP